MFFIISGFLAAKGLRENKSISTWYKKRLISIAPLYYFVILWFFISENILNRFLNHIPPDTVGLGWLRYLFLINGFVNSDTYFWSNLGITWTIPVFAFFYLIAPFVIRYINNWKDAAIALFLSYLISQYCSKLYSCTALCNIFFIIIGLFIYYCKIDGRLLPGAFGFLVISLIEQILCKESYPTIFAVIVCICLEKEVVLPPRIQKVVNIVDQYTYTIYLVHGIVFCSIIDKIKTYTSGMPIIIIASIAIVGTLILTVLIHNYYERPIQEFMKKKLLR